MPPPPSPVLMEELVEEFLLRVPPDDPATLVRAALVCKPWCRLVSSCGFRRRFRAFHRTPPMLGFFYATIDDSKHEDRFAHTTSLSPLHSFRRYWRAVDSRHGRVLLYTTTREGVQFIIWDPITDEKRELPMPPGIQLGHMVTWSAAVFCAADGKCDHLDCQRGPFSVFLARTTNTTELPVNVYSSEVGVWSKVSPLKPAEHFLTNLGAPSALLGNALYFPCLAHTSILKYDLEAREISLIDGPPTWSDIQGRSVLMTTEDGRLGLAYVLEFKLHIWSREVGPNRVARWSLSRVIELATMAPFDTFAFSPHAIGSADGVGIIFLSSPGGLFTIDLKSGHVIKVFQDRDFTQYVIPFMSFYTPGLSQERIRRKRNKIHHYLDKLICYSIGNGLDNRSTPSGHVKYTNNLNLLVHGLLSQDGSA